MSTNTPAVLILKALGFNDDAINKCSEATIRLTAKEVTVELKASIRDVDGFWLADELWHYKLTKIEE